ncbi:hypothetical protein [Oceanirhabdus seepicola]|uniref:Uncharacterized protein n=1 Tax=Oceanirhabdus seepicola TaxID=2828781 RepID=A0A9J6NXL8_9CLOT|nr:hypothetical protein [Oceanirhabdus seepicola]MCM1988373.1 hypothetical protein [Oceanirhabdus seepicola]
MKKIVLFSSLIICILILFISFQNPNIEKNTKRITPQQSVNKEKNTKEITSQSSEDDNYEENTLKSEKSIVYALAFDSVWEMDKALNSDIKYVSIDTKTFKDFSEEDKSELFDYIAEKYNVIMLDMSFEELQDEGYVKDLYFEEGILFKVDKYNSHSTNSVSFEGSKWRSGLGAIGFSFKGEKKNNKWELVECNMTWIS